MAVPITNSELRELRKQLEWLVPMMATMVPATAGEVVHPRWPTARTVNAVGAVIDRAPRLLDEIERLADELDHWRKRAAFAEQFIPSGEHGE